MQIVILDNDELIFFFFGGGWGVRPFVQASLLSFLACSQYLLHLSFQTSTFLFSLVYLKTS